LVLDANEVLRTLIFVQKQIPTRDNRWFSVRIMPYRTFDDRIDGLVITFINITDLKQMETNLGDSEEIHRFLLRSSPDAVIQLSSDLKIIEFNPAAEKFFGRKSGEVINRSFIQMFIPDANHKKAQDDMISQMTGTQDGKFKMQVIAANGKLHLVVWAFKILQNSLNTSKGMIVLTKMKLKP
jgi:two-component system CheB/CheR fusion protein